MTWAPYHNLIHLATARLSSKGLAPKVLRKQAERLAQRFALTSFTGMQAVERDMARNTRLVWPLPATEEEVQEALSRIEVSKGVLLTERLRHVLRMGRRGSRLQMDRLLLVWSANGQLPGDAYREAYRDYAAIPHAAPLSEREFLAYAFFFWDFASASPEEASRWITHAIGAATIEEQIFKGKLDLHAVRALSGTSRSFSYEADIKRLAAKGLISANRLMDEILKMEPGELVESPGRGVPGNDFLKNASAWVSAVAAIARQAHETTGGEAAAESLEEYIIVTRARRKKELSGAVETPWRALLPDVSLALLEAENQVAQETESSDPPSESPSE